MRPSSAVTRLLLAGIATLSITGCYAPGELRSTAPGVERAPSATGTPNADGVKAPAGSPASDAFDRRSGSGAVVTARIEDLFSGRFPGLDVQRTANGDISMLLRGKQPLLVLDGLETDPVALVSVTPSEVERIEVLRNASETAIYGSRGVNGVVVVTTRR